MRSKLSNFFGELNSYVSFQIILNKCLIIVSGLLILYYFAIIAGNLYQTSNPKGIIFGTDNDGGRAIETSIKTRWYNSNHFAPYGNIYFRLSHTLADVIKLPQEDLSASEAKEKAHYFALRIVSLVAFLGLGAFLGWIFFKDVLLMLLFTLSFCSIMGSNPVWIEFIVRPHPDHLLLLTVAIASFFTAKFLSNEEDKKNFILSAMWWGIAMAVKRSVSLYVPGIFFMLLFPWKKDNFKKLLSYIGYMLIPYLIIGFPQNFGFYKHIKFLLYESHNHRLANWDSFNGNLKLMIDQLTPITGLLFVSSFLSSQRMKLITWKFLVFIAIALVPILGRRMLSPGHHHTLPIVTTIIVLIMIGLLQFNRLRITNFQKYIYFALTVMLISFIPPISQSYINIQKPYVKCIPASNEILQLLKGNVGSSNKFVKEPYFPFSSDFGENVKSYWGLKWEDIDKDTTFFGIKKDVSELYRTPPTEAIHKDLQVGWDKKIEFYQSIWDQSEVTSPRGEVFRKIYDGECGYQLWKK